MRAFWIHSPVNIVYLERTTARLDKAWAVTVQSWKSFSSWIIFWAWANNCQAIITALRLVNLMFFFFFFFFYLSYFYFLRFLL